MIFSAVGALMLLQNNAQQEGRWRTLATPHKTPIVALDTRSVRADGSRRVAWVRHTWPWGGRSASGREIDQTLIQMVFDCDDRTAQMKHVLHQLRGSTVEARYDFGDTYPVAPETQNEVLLEAVCFG